MTTNVQHAPTEGRRVVAPYITPWTGEARQRRTVIDRGDGIGYRDESLGDRDRRGVLWDFNVSAPGRGRPSFGEMHPQRQRRCMHRLLCQVCANPADQNDEGVLWLLPDFRNDWPGWPSRAGLDEPPVCRECVRVSLRLCPALRNRAAAIRARECPISGVYGEVYVRRGGSRALGVSELRTVAFEDPAIRFTRASRLVRELVDCKIVPLDEV